MRITALLLAGTFIAPTTGFSHDDEPREGRPRHAHAQAWLGAGSGIMTGSVDETCPPGESGPCSESGTFQTYSANLTLSGPAGLRFRAIRQAENEDGARTPYEMAALLGGRMGRGPWYGFVGAGRILHVDDGFAGDAHGFAWEIVLAPRSSGPVGFEMSFHGNTGEDVDFAGFGVGMRFGKLH